MSHYRGVGISQGMIYYILSGSSRLTLSVSLFRWMSRYQSSLSWQSEKMLALVLFVVHFVATSAFASQAYPVWDITTNCPIPNEVHSGACQSPDECTAYQRINDVGSLATVGRISFLRRLQCTGAEDGKICCPRSGGNYRQPFMNESVPRRTVEPTTMMVGSRVGVDEEKTCGHQSFGQKLLGGHITDIDEFPWMAMLLYDGEGSNVVSPGCGGALISRNFVLTAAHCLVGRIVQKKGNLKLVRLGEYDLNSDPDCMLDEKVKDCTDGKVDVKPKRIIAHPQYAANALSQHHDIGLVQLEKPIEYSDFIQHICLPEAASSNGATAGAKLNVCGWGRTNFFRSELGGNAVSPVKLKVVLPYVDHQNCRDIYRPHKLELGSGQICAGGQKAKDTCAGDSGSPLMFFDSKRGVWVLTGLVSLGVQKCGTEGRPGIYTNVREYVPWIRRNILL
ncbi:CLIP domain-containing serine protease B8-like [Malaya genurostris]|uniref:CLIP domain-containing serine protease B8-like n=1 Tax=Malaya genurostris TaxID=325434 RepID=UPI0026F3D35D|nr:CLIP domain-containing serine protease B8-like [Malaya genurostris]